MKRLALLMLIGVFSQQGLAQDVDTKKKDCREQGTLISPEFDGSAWNLCPFKLGMELGLNTSFKQSDRIIGSQNGLAINLGGQIRFLLNLTAGNHQWRNQFGLAESFSRSPETERWKKATDRLFVSSAYIYSLSSLLGLFGTFDLSTNVIPTEFVEGEPANFFTEDDLGNSVPAFPPQLGVDRVTLAPSFAPVFMTQSSGLWLNPLKNNWMRLELTTGFRLQEYLAKNIRTDIDHDDTTTPPTVTLLTLNDFVNGGPSLGFGVWGQLFDKLITYRLESYLMYSVFRSSIASLPGGWENNINFDLKAAVTLKLTKWLGLNYELSLARIPEIVDRLQMSNNFNLTFSIPCI